MQNAGERTLENNIIISLNCRLGAVSCGPDFCIIFSFSWTAPVRGMQIYEKLYSCTSKSSKIFRILLAGRRANQTL